MFFRYQRTVKKPVHFCGIGLHGGAKVRVSVSPSDRESGVVFIDELSGQEAVANWRNVSCTNFATSIAYSDGSSLSTVEHLLAALYALGVFNAFIKIEGSEVPLCDGSAADFVRAICETGTADMPFETKILCVEKCVLIESEERRISISPYNGFSVSMKTRVNSEVCHTHTFDSSIDSFVNDIAPARTFVEMKNIPVMKSAGLIKGGSIKSAVVFNDDKVVNPCGLRFRNECARHKVLDAIGDFSLAGMPIFGRIEGVQSGHMLNHSALKKLIESESFSVKKYSDLFCCDERPDLNSLSSNEIHIKTASSPGRNSARAREEAAAV
ncbi:UDP-3-O-acyl-N-acetylglucosamine deacetylase [Candidatus Hydrogenosomobacter endosymbioticus]|uniref:UDP-3-O-acyl-N-acetylglucosamine deacetylase n=1 Tax=Candidatus Hydrogenosomobacter endosymbioticus TaxID=2558174 RepID=A0ABM7V9C1_9PROT|nr:UDP-3-O-acyl-N-acetylglucosamine deacetylase [Candidatus Hydrogenosomobacter endosymbioticus]BDB96365.1 UDP-3-O-acyl-N-acetylglucosamine deacetylase [Candidatus Hydrogenosomobacter endosymbioticus]